MMRGRGERIAPVHVVTTWWVVKPFDFPTRSPDAYRWWDEDGAHDRARPRRLIAAAETGNVDLLGHALFNDLEEPVARRHPEIAAAKQRVPGGGRARRHHERQRADGRRAGASHGPRRPAGARRFRAPSSCRGRRRDNRRAVRGRLTARRGPLEPEMEVRFLPPERTDAAASRRVRLPPSPASRNMETLRPLDARLAENTKNARTLAAVVLAAGKGKRLKSSTPKVLHPICGRPALWHVLQGVLATKPNEDRRGRGPRRRRRPCGGAVVGTQARRRSSSSRPSSSEPAMRCSPRSRRWGARRTCWWSAATSIR